MALVAAWSARVVARRGFHVAKIGRWKRRMRHWIPAGFYLVSLLAVLGAVLHPPVQYDALAYRLPRVLHWLADNQWHWIHTDFVRMNTRAPGYEWIAAPLMVFFRTAHPLVIINLISFLLMPGLLYSVFIRLGVSPKVAWVWMWLFPTGYCYALQAGGIGNDLLPSTLALAAVDFSLRARESRSLAMTLMALVATAVMTGAKTSTVFLLPALGFLLLPAFLAHFRTHAPALLFVSLLALPSSFIPVSVANQIHGGDWSGSKQEGLADQTGGNIPFRIAHNLAVLTTGNFTPPVFPGAKSASLQVKKLIPEWWRKKLEGQFESDGGSLWNFPEMQMEEGAGLGIGISSLLLVGILIPCRRIRRPDPGRRSLAGEGISGSCKGCGLYSAASPHAVKIFFILFFAGVAVFLYKCGIGGIARVSAPLYPFAAAALLCPVAPRTILNPLWRVVAAAALLSTLLLLILCPPRPLWPTSLLEKLNSQSAILERARTVYTVYGNRARAFAPAKKLLPAGVKVIGMVTGDDPEATLWEPYGSLVIRHVTSEDNAQTIKSLGIECILVNRGEFERHFNIPYEEWIRRINFTEQNVLELQLRAGSTASVWSIAVKKQ